MTREGRWRKKRYRTDAAFREAHLEQCRRYYADRKDQPVFRELTLTRSYIYHKREALARREAEVTRMYEALAQLIEKRDRLAAEWRKIRPAQEKAA